MPTIRGNGYCKVCGVPAAVNHEYCDHCRRMVRIEARQAYERKRREQERSKKLVLTFSDVVKLADAEGLSYGKYCLKYGI